MMVSSSNIKTILQEMGYKITMETNGFYRMRPLYRNSGNSCVLSVNKKTGWFLDFKTGDSGPLSKLMSMTTNISLAEAEEILGKAVKQEDIEQKIEFDLPVVFNNEEVESYLPVFSFYLKRGISEETLRFFKSGFCPYGKMSDRYVFPIYHKSGELRGLCGRDVTNTKQSKWKKLGSSSLWDYPYFFNKDLILQSREIILVESIGDMLALWEAGIRNTLVTFGLKIGQETLLTVIGANPQRVIIGMNLDEPDENGVCPGQEGAKKMQKQLASWFSSDKLTVAHPTSKDFGQMSKDEILKWKENL